MRCDTLRASGRRVTLRRRQPEEIVGESETRRVLYTTFRAARVSESAQGDDRGRSGQETDGKARVIDPIRSDRWIRERIVGPFNRERCTIIKDLRLNY